MRSQMIGSVKRSAARTTRTPPLALCSDPARMRVKSVSSAPKRARRSR